MRICRADVQIEASAGVVEAFVKDGRATFDSFIAVWEPLSKKIHSGASPAALLYGPLQTCYSTFIGFSTTKRRTMERRACVFGLYVAYSTQGSSVRPPILMSARELAGISEFCKEEGQEVCAAILNKLLINDAIGIVAVDVAIHASSEFPVRTVVDEKNSGLAMSQTGREVAEHAQDTYEDEAAVSLDALMDEYCRLRNAMGSQ